MFEKLCRLELMLRHYVLQTKWFVALLATLGLTMSLALLTVLGIHYPGLSACLAAYDIFWFVFMSTMCVCAFHNQKNGK